VRVRNTEIQAESRFVAQKLSASNQGLVSLASL